MSVLLDGEESEMVFIDHPSTEMSVSPPLITLYRGHPSTPVSCSCSFPSPGRELAVNVRAPLLRGGVFGRGPQFVPSG